MEKPDEKGFVSINWPSKSVPHGGIFHSRVLEPTVNQQKLLKVLLEESKLSLALRKQTALAFRNYENKKETRTHTQRPLVRPSTSRRRSLSAIRESGAFEIVPPLPSKRGEDREKLKQKLANLMAYGDIPEQLPPAVPRLAKPAPKLPTNKEMWHDLVTQIRERAEWLAEMEHLGEAGPHREIINDQIAERMRALDSLGIDSECSTVRSKCSGFSTVRSREIILKNDSARQSMTDHLNLTKKSQGQPKSVRSSGRKEAQKEENVSAYNVVLSPLQYSPRRRM